jgi:tRNA nucleotidyltransferase (CCA-adding enzyme)
MLLGVMAAELHPDLLERLRALPVAAPLLARLPPDSGAYAVGGAVRDLLLGLEPAELDLVVAGDAAELARRIADGAGARLHLRFGTAAVQIDGHEYDIAAARRERYPVPGSLPEVEPAPLAQDLLRRDFTVNALALALDGRAAGELVAAPRALDDLRDRLLRVLHDRSFIDDPTRLFRMARYGSRLGFAIEPHTLELARSAIAAGALATLSGDRVGAELRLVAREPDPVVAFAVVAELGLDAAVAPGFGVRRPEVLRRALALLPADGRPAVLAMAAACLQLSASAARELLDRLGFEAQERDPIVVVVKGAGSAATALQSTATPSQIASVLAGGPPELAAMTGALGAAEPAQQWLEQLRHVRVAINGGDLIAAGVPEGPAIGRGLRAALDAKLDGLVSGAEQELAVALSAAQPAG